MNRRDRRKMAALAFAYLGTPQRVAKITGMSVLQARRYKLGLRLRVLALYRREPNLLTRRLNSPGYGRVYG